MTLSAKPLFLPGKKQSKSTFGSLAFFAGFSSNKRPRHAHTIICPSVAISKASFSAITSAIEADEELKAMFHITQHLKAIEDRQTGSILSVKSASMEAITGLTGSVYLDELWLLGHSSIGTRLRSQIRGALASAPEAKVLSISTTSDAPPRGIWRQTIDRARQIRDGGIIDASFLPAIWEPWFDLGEDEFPPEDTWPLLLPSYPHIAGPEFYRGVIAEARAAGPVEVSIARGQFFNCEPTTMQASGEAWMLASLYPRIAREDSIEAIFECPDVWIGIDLGGADDLSGLAVIGLEDGIWRCAVRAWASTMALDRNVQNQSLWRDFERDGDLRIVEFGEDIREIAALVEDAHVRGVLRAVGIDPALAAGLADSLDEIDGISSDPSDGDVPIHGVRQSAFALSPGLKTIERRAAEGTLSLARQPITEWSLGFARLKPMGATHQLVREGPPARSTSSPPCSTPPPARWRCKERKVEVSEWIL